MKYLWSFDRLLELMSHPDRDVQQWAAKLVFHLYSEDAEGEIESLLSTGKKPVQMAALEYLKRHPIESCVPWLRELFCNAFPGVSAEAILVAGHWNIGEAVQWMRERILDAGKLDPIQIDAMVEALGEIGGDDAYELLKATEASARDREEKFFESYYRALLGHHRTEDINTLVDVAVSSDTSDKIRHTSFGLLLEAAGSLINPSDVVFGNVGIVRLYVDSYADLIRLLAPAESLAGMLDRLTRTTEELDPAKAIEQVSDVEELLAPVSREEGWLGGVARFCVDGAKSEGISSEAGYALVVTALMSSLTWIDERVKAEAIDRVDWRRRLDYCVQNPTVFKSDTPFWQDLTGQVARDELVDHVSKAVQEKPDEIRILNGLSILISMGAENRALDALLRSMPSRQPGFDQMVTGELLRAGPRIVPLLLPRLEVSPAQWRRVLLEVLSYYPTEETVAAIESHFQEYYSEDPTGALTMLSRTGASDFISWLDEEYREGEYEIGQALVLLSRIHRIEAERVRAVARDVERTRELVDHARDSVRFLRKDFPRAFVLPLRCGACRKIYHYEIAKVHAHPSPPRDIEKPESGDSAPYRKGFVFLDDMRCKACGALNQLLLTDESLAGLVQETTRLQVLKQANYSVPSHYPMEFVTLFGTDDDPVSLTEVERERVQQVIQRPKQPGAHVMLAKFYEYVKEMNKAKEEYLAVLNLDGISLEAMAGLARLAESAGNHREAFEWVDGCYRNLNSGRTYQVDDMAEFKKTVREKRLELARLAGVKADDQPVEIRFKMKQTAYPKNRPCPCGSGKKYKLCCMNKDQLGGKGT